MAEAARPPEVLAQRRITRRQPTAEEAGQALFRDEALRRRHDIGQPQPLAVVPISWMAISIVLVAIFVTIAAFLVFGSFSRKESANGILRPVDGEVVLGVERAGTLQAVLIREGQRVEAGQRLFEVRTDSTLLDGRTFAREALSALAVQDQLTSSEARAKAAEADASLASLAGRVAGGKALIDVLRKRRALATGRQTVAEEDLESARIIHAKGFLSQQELRRREDAVLAAELAEEQIAVDLVNAEATQAGFASEARRLRAEAEANAARAVISTSQLAERRLTTIQERGFSVRAPITGMISGLRAARGMVVRPGEPVLTVLPEGLPLVAELYVPSRAIGFIAPGQRARLLYDAYPFQKFGAAHGVVVSVSRTVVKPGEAVQVVDAQTPHYVVRVGLDRQTIAAFGAIHALRPGMGVTADIILEKRSLLEWLFEPLLSSSRRMT